MTLLMTLINTCETGRKSPFTIIIIPAVIIPCDMKGEVLPKPNALPKVNTPNTPTKTPNAIAETVSSNQLLLLYDLVSCFDFNIVINKNLWIYTLS